MQRTKKLTYNESVLLNYAGSLGAAVRNSIDPQDPSQEHYANEIKPRFDACLKWAKEHKIAPALITELIGAGIQAQCSFLTSGFLDDMRAEVLERAKKGGI